MKRQVPSADWGSPAAWSMGLEQEDGGGLSGLMEGIGGGGGWGALMADAGNEKVDDYAGMQHQVGVTGRRDGLRKKVTQNIVEKKQKRMVKNRESAARSRARKQAYTSQLEYEIAALTKENQLLLKYETDLNALKEENQRLNEQMADLNAIKEENQRLKQQLVCSIILP
ncbi:ABSCISIC ACID-INSENSITIVE 5-like protein 5 [Nymphaea thermarum]|nr:ABSCISIC ACID-INSENSITIVE 5-like protein 5 [Nymphaea thermarum]